MKRSTQFGIFQIDIQFHLMKIEHTIDFITLGCQMQNAHLQIIQYPIVTFIFIQYPQNRDISSIWSIVHGGVSLIIGSVDELAGVLFELWERV